MTGNKSTEVAIPEGKVPQARTRRAMEVFLTAYPLKAFNLSASAKEAGVHRHTVMKWIKKYPWFAEKMKDAVEARKDWIEEQLHRKVQQKGMPGVTATIFLAKTQLKDRGYIEREEVDVRSRVTIVMAEEDRDL